MKKERPADEQVVEEANEVLYNYFSGFDDHSDEKARAALTVVNLHKQEGEAAYLKWYQKPFSDLSLIFVKLALAAIPSVVLLYVLYMLSILAASNFLRLVS